VHQNFNTIFRTCDHPFSFAVERHASDVSCMAFECEHGSGIGRSDVVELDSVMTGSGQEALVWRNAKTIHLRVGMRDGS